MKIIDNFHEYSFLSNFSPNRVWFDGILWPTAEHAYQAAKAASPFQREKILECKTPGEAKRKGRSIIIRNGWDDLKLRYMFAIVKAKFEQDPGLKKMLRDLTDYWLIEGNDWGDQFWGCVKVNGEWVGKNHLGIILMDIRDEFDLSVGWWNKKDKPRKDQ
jgi:ribA/ribD-fused uncharacterized protein